MNADALFARLARLQHTRAAWFAAAALALALVSAPLAARLGLRSDWVELLPVTAPSVRDLHRGEQRVGGLSTLTLVATSNDLDAMERWATAMAARLEALPPSLRLRRVEWNVRTWQHFVRDHGALYAPLADLTRLRDDLQARLDWERRSATPGYVNLDDPPEDPRALARRARTQLREATERQGFHNGFFVHANRRHLAIFMRTDVGAGDAEHAGALIARVRRELAESHPTQYASDLRVEVAGDLLVQLIEHDAIERELVMATVFTIVLCVLAVLGLFRRGRAVPLLGGALAVPVLVTFAFARLSVDHLNTSTAFLGSIVIGNGINPGIVWLARYFEERRAGRSVPEAIAATHHGAWAGTFTASLAASLAYGSLVITDFRGFRDFGIIGGVGMVVCWALTLLVLPPLAALWERWRPLPPLASDAQSNPYGAPFARMARRAPWLLAGASVMLALTGVGLGAVAVRRGPLEYDFRQLTSVRAETDRASELNGLAGDIVGRTGSGSAVAVLVERREDVRPLRDALVARRARGAPYGPVRTLDDLLPEDQPAKLAVLADLRRLLLEARPHVDAETQREIDAQLPPANLRALGDADLPDDVATLFTERDGTRGRLLFVEEKPGASIWDGRYLVAWAGAIREARDALGGRALVVGSAPVYADMIAAIWHDGPRAVLASFAATLVLVLLSFRRWRERGLTMAGLLTGVAWMVGTLAVLHLRLNFLNFVALPITFGIGVDYAVNVVRRYAQELDDGTSADPVDAAVRETGGAIVVCSLTTIFGYASLLTSANRALNSFGLAAVIGEVCCVLAAVLGVSALLVLIDRRRTR